MLKKFCFASLLLMVLYAGIGSFSFGEDKTTTTSEASSKASSTSPELADDLKKLQGEWEMKAADQSGEKYVLRKTIVGNLETLSTYHDGELISQQTANIELKQFGPARVARWTNCVRTYGSTKGQKVEDGSFVYRFEENRWIAIQGMLKDNWTSVYIEEFERVESDAEVASQPRPTAK